VTAPRSRLARLRTRVAKRVARGYVAGDTIADAVATCHRLAGTVGGTTIAYWSSDADDAARVTREHHEALDAIAALDVPCYLSVKLPDLDDDTGRAEEVVAHAAALGVRVHLDSLAHETADAALACVHVLAERHDNLGCTLPGRWRRSARDAADLAGRGVRVRVVKGQWPDPAEPGRDARRGFLEVVEALAGRVPEVGVATHDRRLAARALDALDGTGSDAPLEQLFGMPPVPAGHRRGAPLVVYVPYGEAWLPYAIDRALHSPRLLADVVVHLFRGGPRLPT
jgi:proline dehydrogenase